MKWEGNFLQVTRFHRLTLISGMPITAKSLRPGHTATCQKELNIEKEADALGK